MSKVIKIQADLMWAFLDTPNTLSGKYQVDLCNLTPETIAELEELGVKVNNKEGKGFYITAKSAKYPVTTVDKENKPITAKVANGSKGLATCKTYDFAKPYKGVGVGINHLVVTDLIEYTAPEESPL